MSAPTATPKPCLRHSPDTCMAYCTDCTAWHVTRQIALRDARNAARQAAARQIAAREIAVRDNARRIAARETAAAVAAAPRLTVVTAVAPRRPASALTAVA